ncbi:Hypothetical predicted protein [Olea europaea subsp. europaea]|uniref:Uncharacterized protein n=1 Tax=Olea europaea subsp. europaea TaxID=158383 RepID=A0A8S0S044_OLEEU|nr:Hypothetical predicted protein [Olea europaea subsp. europaea]
MSRTRLGRAKDAAWFSGISSVQATFGTRPGCDWDTTLFSGISRQFVGTVCKQCSGRFPATLRTQADFQPNDGSTVCRPCQGRKHVPKHSGQFLGHGVNAIFGISHGHDRDAT